MFGRMPSLDLTVEKNLAFGREQDGLAKTEISWPVDNILKLVELSR